MNPIKTDHLVSTGSFLVGAGSAMNLFGNYFQYNYSSSDEEADSEALFRDWRMVGQDMESVMSGNPPDRLFPPGSSNG